MLDRQSELIDIRRAPIELRRSAFVLMPFHKRFDDIYEYGIKGGLEEFGIACERLDSRPISGAILQELCARINDADIVVALLTGNNSNVLFEVGIAHALRKNLILVVESLRDIPSDLIGLYHIIYKRQIKRLRNELVRHLSTTRPRLLERPIRATEPQEPS